MKLRISFSLCVVVEVLIASLIAIFTALGNNAVVSALFAVSFVVIFSFALVGIRKWYYGVSTLFLISICIVNVILNGLMENGAFDFNYFKKVIMFTAFIIFMNAASRGCFQISNKVIKVVEILPVVTGIFLVLSYQFMGNTATMAGGITLGFTNPNFTGMWLLHLFLFGCLYIMKGWRENKWRLLLAPVLLKMLEMILLTGARGCIIGVVAFFVLLFLNRKGKKLNKYVLLGIVIVPLVIAIVYLNVVYADWFTEKFSIFVSDGKSLDSRVGVWTFAFNSFGQHPITGNYSGISWGSGASQMHNTHVDVLCSYGIFAEILFMQNLHQSMISVNNCIKSSYQHAAFCAFCAIIIMGIFEAAVVAGAMGLNLLTVSLLVLAKYGNIDKSEQSE